MSQQPTERNGSIETARTCEYTFDPARRTNASLRTTWQCPHPTHEGSDYCVFHMSDDERSAHDVAPDDVAERLLANLAVDDPRRNEYVGANLPHLSLTYRQVDGDTNHVLNFQHAEVDAIDLTHGRLDQGLNLREASVERLTLEDATITGDVDVSEAVVGRFEAAEATFREDVDCSGTTFTDSVDCSETVFEEGASFAQVSFEDVADFRNLTSGGDSHVLDDHLTFAGATFHDAARFRQAGFGYVSFEGATFESSTDFEHTDFEGDTVFDGATFDRIADFDEAHFDHDASFAGVQFRRLAEFRGVRFDGGSRTASDDVTFEDATFEGEADFKLATFRFADFKGADCRGELNFDRTTFRARADCHDLTVAGVTNLEQTTFEAPVVFDGSTFTGRVEAVESTFEGDVDFRDVVFVQRVRFDEARFRADADFGGATFETTASFCGAAFEGEANHIEQNASFDDVTFEGDADFRDARFTRGSFQGTTFHGTCDFRAVTFRESAAFELVPGGSDSYVDLTDAVVNGGRIAEGGAPVPYDLTRATLGDVRLEGAGDGHELLDHFRFCLTEFDEFDFSDHHAYLERNDWTIHDFVENDATGSYAVELTNETIEETYRKAQDSAAAVGDTPASREFEFKRYYYNRQKNRDILFTEYSLNAWGRVKKTSSIGLNYFMQVTCGYGNRLPRIAAWTFLLPALFGVLYVLGGPFLTQAGSIFGPGETTAPGVLFDGLYYSYISFSTIGYGDIGPLGWAAKVLAASQGMLNGLFFTLLTFTLFKRVLGGN